MTRWRHKTLSASAIRKQVSRCCINFPHDLTRQILNNQSIKLGRRAWPTGDHGENSQKQLPNPAGFSPPRSVEIKILIVRLMNTTKKIELEPAIIWKVVTYQRIVSKKHSNSVSRYLSPRYGQAVHRFDSCQFTTTWMVTWMYNIRLQAPNLARKCEIKHWYACWADGQIRYGCQLVYNVCLYKGDDQELLASKRGREKVAAHQRWTN